MKVYVRVEGIVDVAKVDPKEKVTDQVISKEKVDEVMLKRILLSNGKVGIALAVRIETVKGRVRRNHVRVIDPVRGLAKKNALVKERVRDEVKTKLALVKE